MKTNASKTLIEAKRVDNEDIIDLINELYGTDFSPYIYNYDGGLFDRSKSFEIFLFFDKSDKFRNVDFDRAALFARSVFAVEASLCLGYYVMSHLKFLWSEPASAPLKRSFYLFYHFFI